ncbi:DUF1146 domain-containing protein [Paenibacillus sp. IB182496]|uniref:DUF1146 domain-containing protein n=1 Tax=Paenibacillus sabuli TaxID=2772509 RepID=A0A927BUA1_9BACL|nr:DUF1146 family protein [Paenibacillus sabuli]MBD2845870.1 DUF1146 domain-containing protein [Paenibacillus sabuli]
MDGIGSGIGMNGLMSIVITLLSITFAWYVIQEIKLDTWLKRPRGPQARMLQVLLAIVLGHGFARFILDYLQWSSMLRWFVE